jgi:nucleoside-diphosphate-sugar epimerase
MEQICYTYHHLYGLDMGVMRFFTVYGPWGRPNMLILALIKRVDTGEDVLIFGKGDAVRTYIYVDDIVSAIKALLSKGTGYQIFNFAGTERVTVNDVVSLVEQSLSKTANVVNLPADPNDSADLSADISHANATLGWQPQNSMRAGIDKTVKWYLDNRDWLIDAIPTVRA